MAHTSFKAIPTFRISSYEKAKSFYITELGFTLDWEHWYAPDAPVYMQVSKNGLVLHLTENERFRSHTIIFVETSGIEDFREELVSNNSGNSIPEISNTEWRTKQMELEDPFGNLLRFNETLEP